MNNFLIRIKRSAFSLVFLVVFSLSVSAQDHQDWSYNLGIYEVNIRQYTEAGTFNAFTDGHLDRLEELGLGILWIMPIHPIGEENRLGELGSYYSIKNFKTTNPNFGTLEDFKNLVQEAHDRDMYVILDWVANHTSWDNVLTKEHPEWYVKNDQGEFIPPPGTNWSDVIELDYSKNGLREYMIDALKYWVDSTGVDGFRFDAVDFVPDDFWTQAIDSLKSHKPDIFLLAESDGEKWYDLGFDMTFGWDMYGFENGILHDIAEGAASVPELNAYGASQRQMYDGDEYRMYFTSNHDINSWEGTTTELFGVHASQFAVLTATLHGMPLIYSGQEAGLNKRLSFFNKDQINWGNHSNTTLYNTLLELKRNNKALWNGFDENEYLRITSNNNQDIFTYLREMDGDRVLVLMNLSGESEEVSLIGEAHHGDYQNVFTDEIVTFDSNTEIALSGLGVKVFASGGNSAVGIKEKDHTPAEIRLDQNFPNPFNPSTQIHYQVPKNGFVTLSVYDIVGKKIASLVNEPKAAGSYSVNFNAAYLSSGVYIYRLQMLGESITKKMMLIK